MGLEERENKRRQSIVKSIVSDSPEHQNDQKDQNNQNDQAVIQDINIIPKAKTETRSKRINLLITPSLYVKVQEKCDKMDISLNECINQFLANWIHT